MQDHVREKPENKHLKSLTLKEFTGLIFQVCPGLEPFKKSLEQIYQNFNAYKRTVPVRGAILLDPSMQKCLMVKGWKKDAGWGFPRGKLSKDETDVACAIREVGGEERPARCWGPGLYPIATRLGQPCRPSPAPPCAQVLEETGYDIAGSLVETDYIDAQLGDQDTRLFIVRGVDESTPFAPHVRYEIGAFGWHLVGHLPASWDESKHQFVTEEAPATASSTSGPTSSPSAPGSTGKPVNRSWGGTDNGLPW